MSMGEGVQNGRLSNQAKEQQERAIMMKRDVSLACPEKEEQRVSDQEFLEARSRDEQRLQQGAQPRLRSRDKPLRVSAAHDDEYDQPDRSGKGQTTEENPADG